MVDRADWILLHHHCLAEKRCFIADPLLLGFPFTAPLYTLNLHSTAADSTLRHTHVCSC